MPALPLDVLVAMTEGSLGYILQQALLNELRKREVRRYVVTVVTQVVVDEDDPAFEAPSKPIGPFLAREEAERRRDERGWKIAEDAGRGWRRLVPSPAPRKVIQRQMIRDAVQKGHIVVACGGGGIPVKREGDGQYGGVEAVIDKDLTSAVLATDIGAELLVILTAVPQVYVGFDTPDQKAARSGHPRGDRAISSERGTSRRQHGPEGGGRDPVPEGGRPPGAHHQSREPARRPSRAGPARTSSAESREFGLGAVRVSSRRASRRPGSR